MYNALISSTATHAPRGKLSARLRKMGHTSGTACASVYPMVFFRLSKITRPEWAGRGGAAQGVAAQRGCSAAGCSEMRLQCSGLQCRRVQCRGVQCKGVQRQRVAVQGGAAQCGCSAAGCSAGGCSAAGCSAGGCLVPTPLTRPGYPHHMHCSRQRYLGTACLQAAHARALTQPHAPTPAALPHPPRWR